MCVLSTIGSGNCRSTWCTPSDCVPPITYFNFLLCADTGDDPFLCSESPATTCTILLWNWLITAHWICALINDAADWRAPTLQVDLRTQALELMYICRMSVIAMLLDMQTWIAITGSELSTRYDQNPEQSSPTLQTVCCLRRRPTDVISTFDFWLK